jgi:hypothetical protein
MEVNKKREVEPLKEFDEATYFTALKDNKLDTYENEIALAKGGLTIPKEILELPIQAQTVLSFYNDKDYINKETGRKTFNDIVESYIASIEDTTWIEDIFEKFDIYDKNDHVAGYKTIVKPEKKQQYTLLKTKAISYWNEQNLNMMVEIFKSLMLGGRKREDMLKDAIVDDALFHPDDNFRLKNRSLAVKVMGMDKNVQMLGMDVWQKGGGREFGSHMAKALGIKSADLSQYIEEDENVKD